MADVTTPFDDQFLTGEGVLFHIFALVSSHSGHNLPGLQSGYTKKVKTIPKELKKYIEPSLEVKALEAAEKGELWYIKVDGDGWLWNTTGGSTKVAAVHEILQFVARFKTQQTVDGSKAFYIEVTNNFKGA